jgi:CubicO group peptidase (beta-lactamase class C family)
MVILAFSCGTSPNENERDYEVVLSKLPKKEASTLKVLATPSQDSIFVIQRTPHLIPFKSLDGKKFTLLHFGAQYKDFERSFNQYANSISLINPAWHSLIQLDKQSQHQDNMLIVLIDSSVFNNPHFNSFIWVINRLTKQYRVVIVNFAMTDALIGFNEDVAIVQVARRNTDFEILTAQALFGAIPTNNAFFNTQKLSITTTSKNPKIRSAYTRPEQVSIASNLLTGIDSLALLGIREGAFPGCQVLIAKNGDFIYNKSFGSPTYEKKRPVQRDDLYDLASITKIAATTLAVMKLHEENKLDLNAPVKNYIKGNSDVHNLSIKSLLTHTSGLQANAPIVAQVFYARDKGINCDTLFCQYPKPPYTIEMAQNVYFSQLEVEKLWDKVFQLKTANKKGYRYSDVNFMVLHKIIETVAKQPLDKYLDTHFYQPMGLRYMTYHPLKRTEQHKIVPTILDTIWRHQMLQGYVHDEGAAFLGGVGGNAGLFSNAEDLGVLFQMLLNEGKYGGKQYLKPSTIKTFTSKQSGVHRGLGFDKPNDKNRYLPYAKDASEATYGHTGYTGTCVWADPEADLLFILLTNRVHPDKRNQKMVQLNIRSAMHQVVYDAIKEASLQ